MIGIVWAIDRPSMAHSHPVRPVKTKQKSSRAELSILGGVLSLSVKATVELVVSDRFVPC